MYKRELIDMSTVNLMGVVDHFIDTAIMRFSGRDGVTISHFYLDIREIFSDRQRITQNLKDDVVHTLESRGLDVESIDNTTFYVTVDLNKCFFNYRQAQHFKEALQYVRTEYGFDR